MQFDKFYVCNDMKTLYVCVCVCVCVHNSEAMTPVKIMNISLLSFLVPFFGPHSQAVIG